MNYYLRIDGVPGDSLDKDHKGWFAIDSLALDALLDGSGRFGDLSSVQFDTTSLPLLTALLPQLENGDLLGAVTLEMVSSDGQRLQQIRLEEVSVSGLNSSWQDGEPGRLSVTLDARMIGVIDYGLNALGQAERDAEFGWDTALLQPVDADSVDLATGGTQVLSGGSGTQYFVRFDGISGNATHKAFAGWFELAAFDGSVLGGAGAQPDWSPVGLQLALGVGLAQVLTRLADAQEISAVQIHGINSLGTLVHEIRLNDVYVTGLDGLSSGSTEQQLQLDFGQVGQRFTGVDGKGMPLAPVSFAWDRETDLAVNFAELQEAAATASPSVMGGMGSQYFVRFNNLGGDSLDAKHKGWFDLPDFDLSAVIPTLTSKGNLLADGKGLDFSPLALGLDLGPALATLLARAGDTGQIGNLEIEGIQVLSGGGTITPFTLRLGGVSLIQAHVGGHGASESLVLDFQQIGVIQRGYSATGTQNVTNSFGWDFVQNMSIDATAVGTPALGTAARGSTGPLTTYYLRIDGIGGPSMDAAHKGWFELSDLDLNFARTPDGGPMDPGELQLVFNAGTALPLLLSHLTTGKSVAAVEIEGVATGPSGSVTLQQIRLQDVLFSSLAEGSGNQERFSLAYSAISLDEDWMDGRGQVVQGTVYSYDLVTEKAGSTALPAASSGALQYGHPETMDYYLFIDGIDGGVRSKGFEGAFQLGDFALDLQSLVSLGAGGAISGKPEFSTLSLNLDLSQGLAPLLAQQFGTGTPLGAARVLGVANTGGTIQTLYELRLNEVTLERLTERSDLFSDGLDLAFASLGLSTWGLDASGKRTAATTFGWDTMTNDVLPFAALALPAAPALGALAGGSSRFFLKIDGVYGNVTEKGHLGWFELDAFSLPTDLSSGAPALGELDLRLQAGSDFAALLAPLLMGRTLGSVQIHGVNDLQGDGTPDLTLDWRFNGVQFTHVGQAGASGEDARQTALSLSADRFGVVAMRYDNAGKPVNDPLLFGYDTIAAKGLDPWDLATPIIGTGVPFTAPVDADIAPNATTENAVLGARIGLDMSSPAAERFELRTNPENLFAINATTGVVTVAGQIGAHLVGQTLTLAIDAITPEGVVKTSTFGVLVGDVPGQTFFGGAAADTQAGGDLADLFQGGLGNDSFTGASGNDSLYGTAGNDRLQGDAGDDLLDGGIGIDTAVFVGTQSTTVSLATTGPQDTGHGMDQLVGIENLVSAGSGDDRLTGNQLANTINAGIGNDTLLGGAGNDRLLGGNGNDLLRGDAGNDTLDGGNGLDTATYATDTAGVQVSLLATGTGQFVSSTQGFDTLIGIEHLTSGSGHDRLTGNDLDNLLSGGNGNDTLEGGAGNDTLLGGSGLDTAVFSGGTAVTVTLSSVQAQNTGHGMDTLQSIENLRSGSGNDSLTGSSAANTVEAGGGNDTVSGGLGADVLWGEGGDDRLTGGDGNDTLIGGIGRDTMIGGAGNDLFLYLHVDDIGLSGERIADFQSGLDQIDLTALGLSTVVASFSGTAGELRVSTPLAGQWLLQGDLNGDAVADFQLQILGVSLMGAGDILL